jgi:hypothetical protein
MAVACRSERDCASSALRSACPGVPMTVACEKQKCRSHRTDGCDPPFEVDAHVMRRMISDCF